MEGRQKPVKNELFTIGPLTVYGYGAMIALGVIAAWIVTEYRARKLRLSSDHVFALVLWGLLGGLVCAKLLYWITEWDSVMKDPGFLLDTLTDGFVVQFLGIFRPCNALRCTGTGVWADWLSACRLLLWKRDGQYSGDHIPRIGVCTKQCAADPD